ncbi:MAG: protein kinase [Planctomycetaceae bacterium]|nr:protein kinase [Planctomycetaceae bacterium]
MTTPSDLRAIVQAALRLPIEQRAEFIEWACGNDPYLKDHVQQELAQQHAERDASSEDRAANDLDPNSRQVNAASDQDPANPTVAQTPSFEREDDDFFIAPQDDAPSIEFRSGLLIQGRYKLVREIGEGGMGTVWVAEQFEPIRRQVAIKLIKVGRNTSQVIARFDAERQALAVMDHPNIARILDGGSLSESGAPFFVMELVKGVPITKYCDQNRLTLAQRIELFVPVCEAIQHAHQKGIIHRDIKPSNILVSEIDGRPAPKVIDFGVAKAMGLALTDKTLNTVIGAVVGTPQYMSPEQAAPNYPDIDTRSDVYSLGVLLYELLTGAPPFDAKKLGRAAILEILRIIREVDPLTPSSKLSTDEGLPSISANRNVEPARLTKMVRGELDWIVMKTLEKDRARRYESASRLADDLRKFLVGEQISAAPPSRWYRCQKFVRRHRVMVTAIGVAMAALTFALVVSITSRNQAVYEAGQAEQARKKEAEQRAVAEKAQIEEAKQRKFAEIASAQAFAALESFSDEFIERRFMSQSYLSPVDRDLLNKALQQWEAFASIQGSSFQALIVQADGAFRVAKLRQLLGEPEVEAGYRESIRLLNLAAKLEPQDASVQHSLSDVTVALGKSLLSSGQKESALQFADQGLSAAQAARSFADSVERQRSEANAHNARAVILRTLNKQEEALLAYRAAKTLLESIYNQQTKVDGSEETLANVCNNSGNLLVGLGRFAEAEAEYRQGLSLRQLVVAEFPNDPEFLSGLGLSWYGLGDLAARQGDFPIALANYQESRAAYGQLVEKFPQNPTYWDSFADLHQNVSSMQSRMNQVDEAIETMRQALNARERLLERFPDFPEAAQDLAQAALVLAKRLEDAQQPDNARREYERALDLSRKIVAAPNSTMMDRSALAKMLLNAGWSANSHKQVEQADAWIQEGLQIYDALPENALAIQADRSEGYWLYGSMLIQRRDFERAGPNFDRAVQALEAMSRAEPQNIQHPATLRLVLLRIAEGYELAQKLDEAIRYYKFSAKVAAEICAKLPDGEDHVVAFGGALNRLSLVYIKDKQPQAALDALTESDQLLDRFLQNHTDSIEAQVLRAGNRINRYDLEAETATAEAKTEMLTKAIEALTQTVARSPKHQSGLMFLHNGLLRRAEWLDKSQQYLAAAQDWQTLAQLPDSEDPVTYRSKSGQSLVRGGQVDQALEVMESLAKVAKPATIFARTRVFALAYAQRADAELADRCVAEIERLVKLGFNDAARLKNDPDLQSIQDYEPFRKIVEKIEGK